MRNTDGATQNAMPKLGFPSSRRLCKADEFSSALSFRPIHKTAHFNYYWLPDNTVAQDVVDAPVTPSIRLGLIVGKRQVKLASGRNLIKRAAREAFRQHALAQLSTRGGLVVRLAKPVRGSPAAPYSSRALRLIYRQELEQAFTQLQNRICNKGLANLSNAEATIVNSAVKNVLKSAVENSVQHSVQKAT